MEATMKNGYWRFQLSEGWKNYGVELKFSSGVNMLLGYTKFNQLQLDWYEIIGWYGATADYPPNMNAQTLSSIWIMCDIVERTSFGCDKQLPLLRVLPVETKIGQVTHNFAIEQHKKVNINRIKEIKIWLAEDVDGTPLDIFGNLFLCLELKKNAE